MNRYASNNPFIPHNEEEIIEMMQNIGIRSLEELFRDIPGEFVISKEPDFEGPLSEKEMIKQILSIASKNMTFPKLQLHIGQGAYLRYVPAVVKEILRRSEFLTSYTPYQPEASQGMLTALFEYQSLMAELLGLEIVNSSMYDWSTALAEAGRMAIRLTGKKKILVGRYVFHQRLDTLNTYIEPMGGFIKEIGYTSDGKLKVDDLKQSLDDSAALYVEYPNSLGFITQNIDELADIVHAKGAYFIVGVEPTVLGILKSPGEIGADIAVGEGQSLGLPLSFGGPSLGIFACRDDPKMLRNMPGRLIGMTEDVSGVDRCFAMVLQTREQHIKREKATSNICTNQALMAIGVAAYLALLGKNGLRELAEYILTLTSIAMKKFAELRFVKIPLQGIPHYQEFAYSVSGLTASQLLKKLLEKGIIGGFNISELYPEFGESIVTCFTEVHDLRSVENYVAALTEVVAK